MNCSPENCSELFDLISEAQELHGRHPEQSPVRNPDMSVQVNLVISYDTGQLGCPGTEHCRLANPNAYKRIAETVLASIWPYGESEVAPPFDNPLGAIIDEASD